jgi:hypothetical protein
MPAPPAIETIQQRKPIKYVDVSDCKFLMLQDVSSVESEETIIINCNFDRRQVYKESIFIKLSGFSVLKPLLFIIDTLNIKTLITMLTNPVALLSSGEISKSHFATVSGIQNEEKYSSFTLAQLLNILNESDVLTNIDLSIDLNLYSMSETKQKTLAFIMLSDLERKKNINETSSKLIDQLISTGTKLISVLISIAVFFYNFR